MDPFVRRLIQRLHDPSSPLSRNRHFHTFATREGRLALRTSRLLKSLGKDLLACREEQGRVTVGRKEARGEPVVELSLERPTGRRTARLRPEEFELLAELPGVRELLPAGSTD